jgi:hypothetical protein
MSITNTGGPAFPFNERPEQAFPSTFRSLDGAAHIHAWGMTLRDYFAAKAMQGLVERNKNLDLTRHEAHVTSTSAYQMADAMLKAREA